MADNNNSQIPNTPASTTVPYVCNKDEFQGVRFYDGVGYGYFRILPNKIELLVGKTFEYKIDTSIAHTYRITGKNKDIKLYIDGKLAIDASGEHTLKTDDKLIEFGSISGREQNSGSAWKNFKYTVDGAFEPNDNGQQILTEIMTFAGGSISAIKSFKDNLYVAYEPDDPSKSSCVYRYQKGYPPENRSTIALTKSNVTSVVVDPNRSGNLFGTSGKFIGTDRGIQYLIGSKPYPWDYVMDMSKTPQENGWFLGENCTGNCHSLFNRTLTIDTREEQNQSLLKFSQMDGSFWDKNADNKSGWTVEAIVKITNDDASLDRIDAFSEPTDYVFVLDNSDKANNENVRLYRDYLFGTFINSLNINDYFTVISYNDNQNVFTNGMVQATGENIGSAKLFAANFSIPSGGALVRDALTLALGQSFSNSNRRIILVGSGQMTDANMEDVPSDIKIINDSGPNADIYSISLGNSVFNASVGDVKKKAYREIADFNSGKTFLTQDVDSIEQKANDIWKEIDPSYFDWLRSTSARQYSLDPRAAFIQNSDKSCLPGMPPSSQETTSIPAEDGINAPSILINDGVYEEVVQLFEKGIRLKYARTFAKIDLSSEFSTIRIIGKERSIAVFVKADSESQFRQILFAPNALFVKASKQGSQESPNLSTDAYGLTHAVWADSKNDNWNIYYSKRLAKDALAKGKAYSISQEAIQYVTAPATGGSAKTSTQTKNSIDVSVLSILTSRALFGLMPSSITSIRTNSIVSSNANFLSAGIKAGDTVALSNLLDKSNERVAGVKTKYTVVSVPDEAVIVLDTSEDLSLIFSSCEFYVYRGTDSWSSPVLVSNQPMNSTNPFVLPHSSGNVYIAYENDSAGASDIYIRKGNSGISSTSFREVARITHGTGFHRKPLLAELGDGKILLVWENNRVDQTRSQIYYTIIDVESFGSILCYDFASLNSSSVKAKNPSITSCGGQEVTVVYEDTPDEGKSEIYVSIWSSSDNSVSTKKISSGDGGNYNPSITSCGNQVNIVWENDASGLKEIMLASGFCADFVALTTVSEFNTSVVPSQFSQYETGFKTSAYGKQYGFIDSDSNNGWSHAYFPDDFGMNVIDYDSSGRIMSLAVTGYEVGLAGLGNASGVAGSVFISGHDTDYHSPISSSAGSFLNKSIKYVTKNKTNPRLLYVTSVSNPGGDERFGGVGLTSMGYNYDIADAFGSGPFTLGTTWYAHPPISKIALDLRTIDFSSYDAVIIASDYGSWLRQEELDILVNRKTDIFNYINSGGGLLAFAESGGRATKPPFPSGQRLDSAYHGVTNNRYGFLPFIQMNIKLDNAVVVGKLAFNKDITQITNSSGDSSKPSVACNAKGDIYVCFEDDRERKGNPQIYLSYYNSDTSEWVSSNQVGVDTKISIGLIDTKNPKVSFDSSGNAILLVQATDGDNSIVASVSIDKISSGSKDGIPPSLFFGPNIATNSNAISSSPVFSSLSNAFDGNTSTYWADSNTGASVVGNSYIGQSFSDPLEIARIQFYTSSNRQNNTSSIKVQFSDNGTAWVDAVEHTNLPSSSASWVYLDVPKSGDHKYWRITPSSTVYSGQRWVVAELQMMAYVPQETTKNYKDPIIAYFPLEDNLDNSNKVINRIRNDSKEAINGVSSENTDTLSVPAPIQGVSWFNPSLERAFDLNQNGKTFSIDSSLIPKTGAVDLWMTPHWDSTDATERIIFGNSALSSSTSNKISMGIVPITGGSALKLKIVDENGESREVSVKNDGAGTNYTWDTNQPVHLRATWDESSIGISSINSVSFCNDSTGIAVGSNGAVFRTSDSGATWSKIKSFITYELYSVDFMPDTTTAYACGELGTVLKSNDGGLTWVIIDTGFTEDIKSIFYNSVAGTIYIAGTSGLLARSTDLGISWQRSEIATIYDVLSVSVANNGLNEAVIAVGVRGSIFISLDDGLTYTPSITGFNVDFNSISRTHQSGAFETYIAGNKGTILKTDNLGIVWNDCSLMWSLGYQPNLLSISHNNNSNKVYVVGQSGVLASSSNSGATWSQHTSAMLNGSFNSIDAWHGGTVPDYIFSVGSGGNVMFSPDGGVTHNYYLTKSGNLTIYIDGKEPEQSRLNDGPFSWKQDSNLFVGDFQFGGNKTVNAIIDEVVIYSVIPNGSVNKKRVSLEKSFNNTEKLIETFTTKRIEFGSVSPLSKSRSHWRQFNIFTCGAKEPLRTFKWTAQVGIQDDIIRDLSIDTRGYLWAATENGLCKFNINEVNDDIERWINGLYAKPNGASRFKNYNGSIDGLTSNSVNTVLVDVDGDVWAGTDDGLLLLKKATTSTSSNADPVTKVTTLNSDNNEDKFVKVQGLSSNKITSLSSDGKGIIVVGTNDGISTINKADNLSVSSYSVRDGLPSNIIQCITYDTNSSEFWIGTDSGVSRFGESKNFNNISTGEGLISNNIFSIVIKKDKKYVNTDSGITVIEGNYKYSLLPSLGIGYGAIGDAAVDDFGSIWFATSSGLVQLDELCKNVFVKYDNNDGISGDPDLVPYQRYRILGGPVPKGACNKALVIVSVNNERMISGYKYNEEGPFIVFDEPRSASDKVEVCIHPSWRKVKCFDSNDMGGRQLATIETDRLSFNLYRKVFSSGTVTLGGNHADGADKDSSMFFVLAAPLIGIPGFISSVSPSSSEIRNSFDRDSVIYTDVDEKVNILPTSIRGLQYIANSTTEESSMSNNDYLSFEITSDAMIYVAYDAKASSLPGWLRDFAPVQSIYRIVDMETFKDASGEEKLFVALAGTNGCVYEIVNDKDACDISDTIALDTTPPEGCAYITKINSPSSVTLSINADDAVTGTSDMQVSTKSDFSDTDWVPFSKNYILTIPPSSMTDVNDVTETSEVINLPSTATFTVFYEWNGKLLIATQNPGRVYEINKSTLELSMLFDTEESVVTSLYSFKRYLLIGTGNNGRAFCWDGTVLNQLVLPGGEVISAISVFNNRAYFGTSPDGKIYEMDEALNISLFMNTYESSVNGFAIFENKLYWTTSNEQISEGDVLTTTTSKSHKHSIICPASIALLRNLNGTTTSVDGHSHAIINGVVQTFNNHIHNLNGSKSGKVFRYDPTVGNTYIVHSDKDYSITAIVSNTISNNGLMFVGTYPNGKILRYVTNESLFVKSFDTQASLISSLKVMDNNIFASADNDLFQFDGKRWVYSSTASISDPITNMIQLGDGVLMAVGKKIVKTSVTQATQSPSQRNICAFVRFRDGAGNVTNIADEDGNIVKCYNPCTLDDKKSTTKTVVVTTKEGTQTTTESTTTTAGTENSNIAPLVHRLTEFTEDSVVLSVFDGPESFFSGNKVSEDIGIYESEVFNGTTSLVQWVSLSWFGNTSTGSSITFAVRSSNTKSGISSSLWSEEFTSSTSNDLTSQSGQYLQFRATLKVTQSGVQSPELYKVDVQLRTSQAVHFFTTNFAIPDNLKRGILTYNGCINPPVTDIIFGISGIDSVDFSEYYPIIPNKVFELPTKHQNNNLRIGIKLISSPQTVPVVDEFALLFSLANDAIIRLNLEGMPTETSPQEILGQTRTITTEIVQGHSHTITFNSSITEKTAINGKTSINAGHNHDIINGTMQMSAQHTHNFEI